MSLAIGFFLGFLGYLPLGNINMAVVQLSLTETSKKLWSYIIFVAIMEFVYCVGCLEGIEVLLRQPNWILTLRWVAVFLFTVLGILSFLHKEGGRGIRSVSGIKRGIFIAIFNPLQVPYWAACGIYLTENHILKNHFHNLIPFAVATTIGTIIVLWLYALGGKKLVEKLKVSHSLLNRFIGVLFFVLAAWQLIQIVHAQVHG